PRERIAVIASSESEPHISLASNCVKPLMYESTDGTASALIAPSLVDGALAGEVVRPPGAAGDAALWPGIQLGRVPAGRPGILFTFSRANQPTASTTRAAATTFLPRMSPNSTTATMRRSSRPASLNTNIPY